MNNLQQLPAAERPREKLHLRGPAFLSDQELLTVLLGSGHKGASVVAVARDVLELIDRHDGKPAIDDLLTVKGVGLAKATSIFAMLEFSRRRIRPEGQKIKKAADVPPLLTHLLDRKQEHFICITLNGANEVLATRIVTIGLVNASQVHPREVFCHAIADRACAVIVAHNLCDASHKLCYVKCALMCSLQYEVAPKQAFPGPRSPLHST
jgi:DNA repair protein RadC